VLIQSLATFKPFEANQRYTQSHIGTQSRW